MLPQKRRLTRSELSRGGFSTLFRSSFLILKARSNKLAFDRFSVTASKGVSPLAIRRNWLRRRGYAFFREARAPRESADGHRDYLLVFLTGARDLLYDEEALRREIGRAFVAVQRQR
ncbi:MAG: ribonuclease P protein component [Candidatus Colwellbacteria bacterium]|nr:ribonuclease P protein component [Candidatus Colwellbacteria bacterium]